MKNLIFIFIFVYGGMVQASVEEAQMKYEESRDEAQRLEGEFRKCLADVDKYRDEFKKLIADWNNTIKTNDKAKVISAKRKLTKHVKTSEEKDVECSRIVKNWSASKLNEMRNKRKYNVEALKQFIGR